MDCFRLRGNCYITDANLKIRGQVYLQLLKMLPWKKLDIEHKKDPSKMSALLRSPHKLGSKDYSLGFQKLQGEESELSFAHTTLVQMELPAHPCTNWKIPFTLLPSTLPELRKFFQRNGTLVPIWGPSF